MSAFKYIRHNLINFIVYIIINVITLSCISIETYEYFESPYKIFNQFNNDDTYFNISFNNTNHLLEPSGNKFDELISKEFNSEITNIIPIINLKDFKEDNIYLVNDDNLEVNKIYMDILDNDGKVKDQAYVYEFNMDNPMNVNLLGKDILEHDYVQYMQKKKLNSQNLFDDEDMFY